jgi:primary-amine oxidase
VRVARALEKGNAVVRLEAGHPLDPLSAGEIEVATRVVRKANPELERPSFAIVALAEPSKEDVIAFAPGDPIARRARVVVLDSSTGTTYEGIVSLNHASLDSWRVMPNVQPPIMQHEMALAERVAKADRRFVEALERRGIEDVEKVQVDPLAAGFYDHYPSGRRILWATPYLRAHPGANAYARPIENLRACIDLGTGEVLEVVDGDAVPLSTANGDYDATATGPAREDLKALDIVQLDGPSFTVDGQIVRWQKWQVHVALHPVDGLVLSDLRYPDSLPGEHLGDARAVRGSARRLLLAQLLRRR